MSTDDARQHHPDCPVNYWTDKPERCRCVFMAMLDKPTSPPAAEGADVPVVLTDQAQAADVKWALAFAIIRELPLSDDGTGHVVDCGWDDERGQCGCFTLPERIAALLKAHDADLSARLAAAEREAAEAHERLVTENDSEFLLRTLTPHQWEVIGRKVAAEVKAAEAERDDLRREAAEKEADTLRKAADDLWLIFLRLPVTPSPLGDHVQRKVAEYRRRADRLRAALSPAGPTTDDSEGRP